MMPPCLGAQGLLKFASAQAIEDQPRSRPPARPRKADTSPAINRFRLNLLMISKPRAIKDPIVDAARVLTVMLDLHVTNRLENWPAM
jgi:hypothetical protein